MTRLALPRAASAILLLAAAAAPAPAQDAAASLTEFHRLIESDKLMPALVVVEKNLEADPATIGQAAQYWSFSGDIAKADKLFAQSGPIPAAPTPNLAGAQPEPAIEAILRRAQGKRIVIINEAHHAPRHRAFTHQLMLALRQAGFTMFAAETFCNGCPNILSNGAPTFPQTGVYTYEPVFGDLARQAGAVGYQLAGYEMTMEQRSSSDVPPEESINSRERAQAENLKAVLDANPQARVLVHVGFGHVNEATRRDSPLVVFATRLKQLTGEDPLTIDQTEGTPQADAEHDTPLYKAYIAAFGSPQVPMAVANDPDKPLGLYNVDLSVIHPAQHDVNGRPDWLAMGGYRKPRQVTLEPLGERTLVRAFVKGEPAKAVAMDQILAGPGAEAVTLMLPAGTYRLVRQTEKGEDLPLGEVEVS